MAAHVKKEHYIYALLVLGILFGAAIRFYDIGSGFLWRDEAIILTSAVKYQHNGQYDPRLYNYEHPPLGKWIAGVPSKFIAADYSPMVWMPQNMYVWTYISFDAIRQIYSYARGTSAFLGVISVLLVFLVGKEIYGTRAGLWSAAIMALSFDFLIYSRIIFLESSLIAFTLITLYFYVKYLKSAEDKKRMAYLVVAAIFLFLTLLTRTLQPLFLLASLAVSQFFLNVGKNKKTENLIFVILLILGYFFAFYEVWPAELREASMRLANFSLANNLNFSFPDVIYSFLLRNSYLFTASLFAMIYVLFFCRANNADAGVKNTADSSAKTLNLAYIRRQLSQNGAPSAIWIAFFISFFAFGILNYGLDHRYLIFLYIPMIILAGRYVALAIEKEGRLKWIFAALVLANIYGIVAVFPDFYEYSNFGRSQFGDMGGTYHAWPAIRNATGLMNALGYPPVLSNDINMLVFYPGAVAGIPIPYETACTPDYIKSAKSRNFQYVVYHDDLGEETVFSRHKYFCPYFVNSSFTKIAAFGERDVIQVYKIN